MERATTWLLDANYNRTQLRDGEGNITAYAYDANNRLTQVTRAGLVTTFTYDPVGGRIHKTLPGGAYTDYTYNSRNLLTLLENRKSDQSLLSSFAYGLDYVGNRTSMTEGNEHVTTLLMAPGR